MTAVGALVDFDAFDIDLPTREGEWIGGGAALEVVTAALLAGSGLGHGEKYGAEALLAHQVSACASSNGSLGWDQAALGNGIGSAGGDFRAARAARASCIT